MDYEYTPYIDTTAHTASHKLHAKIRPLAAQRGTHSHSRVLETRPTLAWIRVILVAGRPRPRPRVPCQLLVDMPVLAPLCLTRCLPAPKTPWPNPCRAPCPQDPKALSPSYLPHLPLLSPSRPPPNLPQEAHPLPSSNPSLTLTTPQGDLLLDI